MKYCAYCGKPIENGQCTCEGALAEQAKAKQTKKKLTKVAIPVVALCLLLAVALVALQYMTAVKLTDFVKIDTYGKSGSGKVSCTIDETALQKYLYPNTDEDMEELDLLEAFEMELQQWEYVDHIKSCVTITPSKEENLSNGDILKIKVEFENEKDYELNETFRGGTIEYTVSDLYEYSKASQTENVSLKTEEKAENQEENKEKPESTLEQYIPTPEDFNKPAFTFNVKVDDAGTVQYTTNKNNDGTVTVYNYNNGTETGYTKYSYDGTNIRVVVEEIYESEDSDEVVVQEDNAFAGKTYSQYTAAIYGEPSLLAKDTFSVDPPELEFTTDTTGTFFGVVGPGFLTASFTYEVQDNMITLKGDPQGEYYHPSLSEDKKIIFEILDDGSIQILECPNGIGFTGVGDIFKLSDTAVLENDSADSIPFIRETVSAGGFHIAAIKSDGTVVAANKEDYFDYGQFDVEGWQNIVAVAAGSQHTIGLRADGTVVVAGDTHYKQSDVDDWSDIVAIDAGDMNAVGLRSDGTVVSAGSIRGAYESFVACDVEGWSDIVAIAAGSQHTVGLRSNGTVVATGSNGQGQCDVEDWQDIVAISVGDSHTVGLKSDGTVVTAGGSGHSDEGQCDVEDWTNIIAISANGSYTMGLQADGTVMATGNNSDYLDQGQCDVEDWDDIVAISAGVVNSVGLRSDGTVVVAGRDTYAKRDAEKWTDIALPESL